MNNPPVRTPKELQLITIFEQLKNYIQDCEIEELEISHEYVEKRITHAIAILNSD